MAEVPASLARQRIAASGPTRFGGVLVEDFLPELRWPRAGRTYDEMRKNSPIIGGFLKAVEAAFRSTRYNSIPWDDSPEAQARATFLQQCINDMERPWSDNLTDILTMLPFGFAPCEMVFKLRQGRHAYPKSKYSDGAIGLRDLSLIPQASILEWIYNYDDPYKLESIRQFNISPVMGAKQSIVEIPMAKVCNFRIQAEKNSPEGVSILRTAYRPWYFMSNLEVVEAIALERTGAGIPVIHLPPQATTEDQAGEESDMASAKRVVKQIRMDEQAGVVEPDGWAFRIELARGLRPELFDLAIKRHRSNMLISVLAAFLELGTARVGSFATAKVGRSFFEVAFDGWVMAVEDTFNETVVPLLFELNGVDDEKLPKLGHTTLGGEDLETIVNATQKLLDMGILAVDPSMKDYFYSLMRLPSGSSVVERESNAPKPSEEQVTDPAAIPEPIPSTNGSGPVGATNQPHDDLG